MPYKTKFRKVQVPTSRDEMDALGRDANSMRSLGAAFYRQGRTTGNVLKYGAMVLAGTESFMEHYYGGSDERTLRYWMDGFMRAARQAGDNETVQNLPAAVGQLRSRLQERFPPKRNRDE